MMEAFEFLKNWVWLLAPISVAMFLGSLALMPILLIRLPDDYFIRKPIRDWSSPHPLVHLGLVIGKNILGAILIGLGIVMLVLPGQGLLTILLGIGLMDFPGKRSLERRLIRYRPILRSANWLRQRYGKPPFVI